MVLPPNELAPHETAAEAADARDASDAANADKETGRLEAFSDGVFSIAITLLALELRVPNLSGPGGPTARALWTELGRLWPSYLAFVTSFFTVLIMWVNHHGIFRLVRRTNHRLL